MTEQSLRTIGEPSLVTEPQPDARHEGPAVLTELV
jgi:hypothetical protein